MLIIITNGVSNFLVGIASIFILVIPSFAETPSKNISSMTKPLYFQNGRYHELPKVTIESKFIVSKNGTTWILEIPPNIRLIDDFNKYVVVTVTGTFPFYAFHQNEHFKVWHIKRRVNGDDIFNTSSFTFEMTFNLSLASLKYKNDLYEFRSNLPPFFGISFQHSSNEKKDSVTFATSTSIPASFKDYIRVFQIKRRNKSCEAYFFVKQILHSDGQPLSLYSCVFPNGKAGVAKALYYYPDHIATNHVDNGNNCWMEREMCEETNSCALNDLPISAKYYSRSRYVICTPEEKITDNLVEVASTPIFVSLLEHGLKQMPKIYFSKENIQAHSMIRMEPFEGYQHLSAELVVRCTIVEAYATHQIRFGIKQKHIDNITMFPEANDAEFDEIFGRISSSYNITLNNVNIEKVFCFAAVHGSYDWINASVSVSVHEFSSPKFITEPKYPALFDEDIVTTESTFTLGSKKVFISCEATGYPPPKISWTRNSIPLEFTEEGDFPNITRRSVIAFQQIDIATEGVYVCQAQNSEGTAKLLYNVFVTDNSTRVLALSAACVSTAILLIISGVIALIWTRLKRQKILLHLLKFRTNPDQDHFINYGHEMSLYASNHSNAM